MKNIQLLEEFKKEHDGFIGSLINEVNKSERDDIHRWYLSDNITKIISEKEMFIQEIINVNNDAKDIEKVLTVYLDEIKEEIEYFDTDYLGTYLNTFREFYFDLYISLKKMGYKTN